jgi:hypothetical protein
VTISTWSIAALEPLVDRARVLQRSPIAIATAVVASASYAALLGLAHCVPRYDCIFFPFVAMLTFWALANVRGGILLATLLGISTLSALAALAHLWSTGHEGRSAVLLGIVPYSDAGEFYEDAQRMLYGLRFGASSRRPLYVAVLGAILRWTGDDLRRALAISTIVYGGAMGFVTWEIMRRHGRTAGFLVYVLLFFWVRRFTGFVATEALSFPLGALAFVLLLRSAEAAAAHPADAALAFGVALLSVTLALIARPGPMLVVPALLLWALTVFNGRGRWLALAAGTIGIAAAMLATHGVTSRLSNGVTFGDYPSIAYSLLHRADLNQVAADHPELETVAGTDRARAIVGILEADVLRDPSLLLLGPGAALLGFFVGPHGLFSFVWTNPDDHVLEDGELVRRLIADHGYVGPLVHWVRELGLLSLVNAAAMGFAGIGFVIGMLVALHRLFRTPGDPSNKLYRAVLGGVIVSSVFAPVWIGEGMQMQTAVFPFVPAAFALGLIGGTASGGAVSEPRWLRGMAFATMLVTVLLATGIAAACAWPWPAERSGCGPGVMSARLNPSTRTILRSAAEPPPNLNSLSMNFEFLKHHNATFVGSVRRVARVGDAVELVYDSCDERTRIAFGSPEALPATRGWTTLRFEAETEPIVVRVSMPDEERPKQASGHE